MKGIIAVAVFASLAVTPCQAVEIVDAPGPYILNIISADPEESNGVYTGEARNMKMAFVQYADYRSCSEAKTRIKANKGVPNEAFDYIGGPWHGYAIWCQPYRLPADFHYNGPL